MVLPRAIARSSRAFGNLDNDCSLVKSAFDTPTCTARLGPPAIPSRARSTPALLHTHGQLPLCSHVRVGPTDTAEGGLGEGRLGGGRQHGETTAGRARTSFSQTYRSGSAHRRVQLHIACTCTSRTSSCHSINNNDLTDHNSAPP